MICSFKAYAPGTDKEPLLFVTKVTAEEAGNTATISIEVASEADPNLKISEFVKVNTNTGRIELSTPSFGVATYSTCLVACGLGHIVQDVIDCLKAGNKTPKSLISCLKAKGHALSAKLANSAIACIPAGFVGP